jgi:hypothetical protein
VTARCLFVAGTGAAWPGGWPSADLNQAAVVCAGEILSNVRSSGSFSWLQWGPGQLTGEMTVYMPAELAKLLGHPNIKMTERYAKLAKGHIAKTGDTARRMWRMMAADQGEDSEQAG